MNKSIPLKTYVASAILCLTLFASCSADDDTTLPEGKYPMTFATAMEGLTQTRATTDNTWTGSERIAVQVGGEVKEYTAAADGRLSAGDPFYWNNSQETKTVSAWYVGTDYNAVLPTSWAVQPNQSVSAGDNYQRSDFLYAAPTEIDFANKAQAELKFYHQTARVVINIVNAEAATDANDINSVVIGNASNLALTGKYTAPAAGSTVGTWETSSGHTPQMGIILPKETAPTGSNLKSYAALVIPQNMTGRKFIAVELTNGNTYYYTPKENNGEDEANLQSGKQYTYDITVKHGYLEVNASSSGAWGNGGSENVNSQEPQTGFSATDLKIGDYYYSDGTYSDGGYRKYGDGTTAQLDIKPDLTNGRKVIGIVFWVGSEAFNDDPLLKNDHSECKHGLVVALQDATLDGSTNMNWSNQYGDVQNWVNRADNPYKDVVDIQETNKMCGYSNTLALKAYNEETGDGNGLRVLPCDAIQQYSRDNPAPTNSSGWYFPSIKELKYVCWGQGQGEGTAGRNYLNTQIGVCGGSPFVSDAYWSSTELRDASRVAWNVNFDNGVVYLSVRNGYAFRVRPLLAF